MAAWGENRKLTPLQVRFIEAYLIKPDATNAAIKAGYAEKTAAQKGYELTHNNLVAVEIQKRMDKRAKKTEITAEYVLNSLKSVAERCQQIEAVLDKEGNPTGEYRFEHAGANKALELLGKNLKLFTDRLEIRVIEKLEDLSEDEIASIREDLRRKIEG